VLRLWLYLSQALLSMLEQLVSRLPVALVVLVTTQPAVAARCTSHGLFAMLENVKAMNVVAQRFVGLA
jgi:hypothetical protein